MAAVTDGIGSRGPITPVEATSTCSRGTSSAMAAVSTISQASARPPSPVQALARPELVTIARAVPERIWVRLTITGAATTELSVNTPAAEAGDSESTSARSAAPSAFMPQAAMPAW